MKQFYDLMKKCPLAAGIFAVVLGTASIKFVGSGDEFCLEPVLLRLVLSFMCIAILFMISGDKVLVASGENTGLAFKKFIPLLIYSVLLGGVVFISNLKGHKFVDNLPSVLFFGILEMMLVGLFEELTFRAVFNDALLYQFRDKKRIFVAIAIISCLVFGMVHVLGADISTPLNFAQAALKTITTGLWGFTMLVVYWKTHNIWVGAIVHGIYDIASNLVNLIFAGNESSGYVLDGSLQVGEHSLNMGVIAIGFYIFQMIPMIIITLIMIKTLKSIDFEKIRKEW